MRTLDEFLVIDPSVKDASRGSGEEAPEMTTLVSSTILIARGEIDECG